MFSYFSTPVFLWINYKCVYIWFWKNAITIEKMKEKSFSYFNFNFQVERVKLMEIILLIHCCFKKSLSEIHKIYFKKLCDKGFLKFLKVWKRFKIIYAYGVSFTIENENINFINIWREYVELPGMPFVIKCK
jgi:hypothetical protein